VRLVSPKVRRSKTAAGTVMVTTAGSSGVGGSGVGGSGVGGAGGGDGGSGAGGGIASSSRAATVARSRDATLMSCTTAVWLRRCWPYSPTANTSWSTVLRIAPRSSLAGATAG